MRIFWRHAVSDAATITASNTASGYRAANLQIETLGKRWASDSVSATAQLLVDYGSAVNHDAFAMLGHNLVPGSDSVTLKYASDAGITADVVTISHTLTAANWYEYFAPISRQYMEVVITKSLSTNQVHAGRLPSGEHYQTSYGLRPNYPLGTGKTETSSLTTRGGVKYSSTGGTRRILSGTFPGLSNADYDEIEELQQTNSTGKAFIISLAWETEPTRKSLYGTLDRVSPPVNAANVLWEWSPRMTEQK